MVCNNSNPCPKPTPCTNSIADPNFIVVPTGGCWARADFAEVINRTVITKSIVAIDCADDDGKSLSQYIIEAAAVLSNNGQSNDTLSALLDKLRNCIINNNGVISPVDPIVSVYVIDANTQQIIVNSQPQASIIPVDFSNKFAIVNGINSLITYEGLLALPSTWYEFVAPDVLDPTHQSIAYRYVSYASEFYRLVVHVRLTPVPVLYPCSVIDKEEDECEDECNEEDDCNTLTFGDCWCPA
jgi:hypothetical protein